MIDIEQIISKHLIDNNVAGGNVIILNHAVEYVSPAVMIQMTLFTGNKNEGAYQASMLVSCIADDEYDTLNLADTVRDLLDGYGDTDIEHVEFVNLIPNHSIDVSPSVHCAVMTFNVLYYRR